MLYILRTNNCKGVVPRVARDFTKRFGYLLSDAPIGNFSLENAKIVTFN